MPSAPINTSAATLEPSLKCAVTSAAVLLETLETLAAMIMLGRKSVAQDAVEPLPRRQRLRAFVLADYGAVYIEDFPDLRFHTEIGAAHPELFKRSRHDRLRDDAGAAAGELALDPLVDVDRKALPAQHQAREQAAHRAADDQRAS